MEVLPIPATCADPSWPTELNTNIRTNTGDLVDCNQLHTNANEGKLSLRVPFYLESDSWLFVCVSTYSENC